MNCIDEITEALRLIDASEDNIFKIMGYVHDDGTPTHKLINTIESKGLEEEEPIDYLGLIEGIPHIVQTNNMSYNLFEGIEENKELRLLIKLAVNEIGYNTLKDRIQYYYNTNKVAKKLKNWLRDNGHLVDNKKAKIIKVDKNIY